MGIQIFTFVTDCYENRRNKWNWTITLNTNGVIASGVADSEQQARNAITDHLIGLKNAADLASKRAKGVAAAVGN